MKILSSLLADFINETKDGRLNIIGAGITHIFSPITPSKDHPSNGSKVLNFEDNFQMPGKWHNFMTQVSFPVFEKGDHSVELFINGKNDASLSFSVVSPE